MTMQELSEFGVKVNQFTEQSYDQYHSYSAACGYLGVMCIRMFERLSKRDQEFFMQVISASIGNVNE